MDYIIEYSSEALLQLERLEKTISKRIIKKIDTTTKNPHLFFKKLSGRIEFKLRVEDYRIIAEINENKKIIFIRTLGHRKNIYK